MPELQRLRADHAEAVLAFEVANRDYFAITISDRGDEYFSAFADQHSSRLAEQEAGLGAYHVLIAEDGSVVGRFNLIIDADGTAQVGYRVARHVAGRGVATAGVRELCRLAATRYGLHTLRAATSEQNVASQKVLTKAGFVPVSPADPADLGGKQGTWYERDVDVPAAGALFAAGGLALPVAHMLLVVGAQHATVARRPAVADQAHHESADGHTDQEQHG